MNERARPEDGFTLVELLITILLTALITGAMSTAFMTALQGSQSTGQRIRESNDAQLIATYLTRDAQAAGGSDPSTNTRPADSTLGVTLDADAGCPSVAGTPVVSFKWIDWSSATSGITRVTTYWYDSSDQELLRQACATNGGTTTTTALTLGTHIGSVPAAPTAACVPAADCPGTPDQVELTISETNNPQNAPTPYTYHLWASLRPQAGLGVGGSASTVSFLLLGGSTCAPDMSSQGGGASTIEIYGPALLNSPSSTCQVADFSPSPDYGASGGTYSAGNCAGVPGGCLPGTSVPDPFASLPYPSGTTANGACPSGSGNPAPSGNTYSPGTYHDPLTISSGGTKTFASGTYIFCNGLTVSGSLTSAAGGVLIYIAGGTLSLSNGSSMTVSSLSGGYQGSNIVVWQRAADTVPMNLGQNDNIVARYDGTVYVPGATVDIFKADFWARALIAKSVDWAHGGNKPIQIGGDQNAKPSITGPGSITSPWTKSQTYPSATMTATGGAAPYTWSATGLPNGLTIDSNSGVISGTPTTVNTFNVTVKVTDFFGNIDTKNYTVTINAAPTISGSLPSWTVNRAYNAPLSVSGGTAPMTWSATGLPTGLGINSNTGVVSGTPAATGSFSPKITVTDSTGATDINTYSTTINSAPSITTTSLPDATQGVSYSTTVVGTSGTTPYTWSATGLPAPLTINPSTGVISGTPTSSGAFAVTVTLKDNANASVNKSFTLTVSPPPLTITTLSASVKKKNLLSFTLGASGGTAPLSWSMSGAPAWVSLNATTGRLTGTAPNGTSTNKFTVTVTDAAGAIATVTFTLTVTN